MVARPPVARREGIDAHPTRSSDRQRGGLILVIAFSDVSNSVLWCGAITEVRTTLRYAPVHLSSGAPCTFRGAHPCSKDTFIVLVGITSLALQPAFAEGPISSIGKGEGQVDIVAWPGYIERGETDKNYDWVTDFEKKTSCKVNVKTAGTSDEMVALDERGRLRSGDGVGRRKPASRGRQARAGDQHRPGPELEDRRRAPQEARPGTRSDGKHYGVPYQWGPNVLMYNTEVFKEAPKSWNVVFEEQNLPDGKPNKGRVQAYDGAIYIADAALYLMTHKPELGIKDPYELNEDQYKAALDLLRKQKLLVQRYWHDAMVQIDDFKNEGVVASGSWPFQVNLLGGEKKPIASIVPEEGATGWADSTMMHAEAAHPNCAYMWIEHSLSPKVQGDLASWFGSVPSVPQPARATRC